MVNHNSPNNSNESTQDQKTDWDELTEFEYKPVEIPTDGIARIETSDAPMSAGRQDKRVDVVDSKGTEKRTSNLMLGYNKREVQIGERYYSVEDLQEKALEYLESDEEDASFYVRRDDTEKRFCEPREVVDDIMQEVMSGDPKMDLSPSSKITNQDARHVEAYGANGEKQNGVFMLGNIGLEMPNGTYVSAEIVEKALDNYLKAVPVDIPPPVVVPPTETPNKPERAHRDKEYRVIDRIRQSGKGWVLPVALAATALLAAIGGFGGKEAKATSTGAEFGVSTTITQTEKVEMTPDESYDKILEETVFSVDTGDEMDVPAGVEFHESSDYAVGGANNTGTFGEGIREAGEYTLEYISVLGKDGQIRAVEYEEGKNLGEFVKETAEKEGVPEDELVVMICLGGPESGWVNIADVARKQIDFADKDTLMKEVITSKDEQFSGSTEDFNGTVSFQNERGETVEVNFLKEDGTMAAAGETVTGSDGREYRVENLVTTTTSTNEKQITWSLADAAKVAALAGAASAILWAMFGKRKRKEMVDMTGMEIKNLIQSTREGYGESGRAGFGEDTRRLLGAKGVVGAGTPEEQLFKALVGREITVEDIEKLNQEGE